MGLSTVDVQSEVQKEKDSGLHRKTDGMLSRGRDGHGAGKVGRLRCSREPRVPSRLPESRKGSEAARTAASLRSFGLHFSAADGTEHLFMCLLIIYVPLLGKRLFEPFAPF